MAQTRSCKRTAEDANIEANAGRTKKQKTATAPKRATATKKNTAKQPRAKAGTKRAGALKAVTAPERVKKTAGTPAPEKEDAASAALKTSAATQPTAEQNTAPSPTRAENAINAQVEDIPENRGLSLLKILIASALSAAELNRKKESCDALAARVAYLTENKAEDIGMIIDDNDLTAADKQAELDLLEAEERYMQIPGLSSTVSNDQHICEVLEELQKKRNKLLYDYADINMTEPPVNFSDDLPRRFEKVHAKHLTVSDLEKQYDASIQAAKSQRDQLDKEENELLDEKVEGRYRRWAAWIRMLGHEEADVENDDFHTLRKDRLQRLVEISEARFNAQSSEELHSQLRIAEGKLYAAEVEFNDFVMGELTARRHERLGQHARED